jgi:hypothetical protein
MWTVLNDGDSTRVAGDGGDTLRFELLPGARAVDVGDLRMRGTASLVNGILHDRLAVPPGEREVVITYEVPYVGRVLEIERAFDLPTAEFRLLVTGEGVGIESQDLEAPEAIPVEGRAVIGARAGDLAPGARIRARVTGLPAIRAGDPRAVVRALPPPLVDPVWLAAGVLALTAAGVVAVVLYPGRGGWQPVAARRRRLADERRRIVAALARLDGELAAGGVDGGAYARRRAELMDRAMAVARRQRELEEGP